MVDTTIVALPSVDDKVNRISSEDAAHLTILYLGELTPEQVAHVIEFTEHAASQLSPFGASVDYRGTLGPKDADVLFFKPSKWDLERVESFRHWLLADNTIKTAYDSIPQYPEWTPHLTLGYPESPAHEDDSDYPGINYVNFDRIAVWIGDSEGPEFRLKYDDYGMDGVAAMSNVTTTERGEAAVRELFHHGVKGMKWGVRKAERFRGIAERSQRIADGTASRRDRSDQFLGLDRRGVGGAYALHPKTAARMAAKYGKKADKAQAKVDAKARKAEAIAAHKKWKEEVGGTEMANKVFQKAAKDFEKTAEIINNDPNYKDKDVTKGLVAKQYQATMNHYFNEHMAQASVDLTLNDQGQAYIYQFDAGSGMMKGSEYKMVSHAEASKFQMPDYNVELDDQGHMVSFTVAGQLYHHGVKGMKWGVTNNADGSTTVNQTKVKKSLRATDKPVTVTQKKAGTYVKAKGGQRQTASTDAVKTQAARQKAKRSTTDSLSNKQLKDAVERMRLEQEFAKLDKKVSRKGSSFVSKLLAGAAAAASSQQGSSQQPANS